MTNTDEATGSGRRWSLVATGIVVTAIAAVLVFVAASPLRDKSAGGDSRDVARFQIRAILVLWGALLLGLWVMQRTKTLRPATAALGAAMLVGGWAYPIRQLDDAAMVIRAGVMAGGAALVVFAAWLRESLS